MANRFNHESYDLKPSRIALGFQILCLIILILVIYLLSPLWILLICSLIAVMSLFLFRQQDSIAKLEQLDYENWSVQYQNLTIIKQLKIDQFVDHLFYISVHFHDKNCNSLIIWQDQVSPQQWKSLKTRCKF